MIHNILTTSIISNGSAQARASQGLVNGLLFSSDANFTDDVELTVTLMSGDTQDVIVNSIGLRKLAGISAYDFGFNQTEREIIADTAEGLAITGQAQATAVRLDLGCIHLAANGGELEVRLQNRGLSAVGISVSSYYDTREPDHYFKYIESNDTDQDWPDLMNLFAVLPATDLDSESFDYNEFDCNFNVTTPEGSTLSEFTDVVAHTMTAGSFAALPPTRIFEVWNSPDNHPDDTVHCRVTGTDTSSVGFVGRSMIADVKRVSKSTKINARSLAQKVRRMRRSKARALRRMGLIIRGRFFDAMANKANDGTKPSKTKKAS